MFNANTIKKIQDISDPIVKQKYLKYAQLPEDVRELFFNLSTAQKIQQIGQENNLSDKQMEQASYTIGMVLLGETNIVNFVKTLHEKCQIDEQKARKLARHINKSLFLPARESLKKIHQVAEWPREEENQAPSNQPNQARPIGPRIEGNIVDLKQKEPGQEETNIY